MRPRRVRLGWLARMRVHSDDPRGFNEAEARTPRMVWAQAVDDARKELGLQ